MNCRPYRLVLFFDGMGKQFVDGMNIAKQFTMIDDSAKQLCCYQVRESFSLCVKQYINTYVSLKLKRLKDCIDQSVLSFKEFGMSSARPLMMI